MGTATGSPRGDGRRSVLSERMPAGALARALGGQPLAPLGAARADDIAPADSRHPRAEAMTPLADQLARLVGAFHGTVSDQKAALPIVGRVRRVNRAARRGRALPG